MAPAGAPLQGFGAHWLARQRIGEPAEVVTFYSYKGGTGRTMGMVNCAGLIAQQLPDDARPLLLVDFDLEAPGLHRYLAPCMPGYVADRQPGVLELFTALDVAIDDALSERGLAALDDEAATKLVAALDLAPYKVPVRVPAAGGASDVTMELIVAGRFDAGYDARLEAFRWTRLLARAPALFRAVSARLAAEHSLVFVDSRTGLSDTSGISTMLLPDVLVVVFTPNTQSLTGVDHLVRRAVAYRAGAADLRPLRIYPLPSRVDNQVEHFRQVWRVGQAGHPLFGDVAGYQPMFTTLLEQTLAAGLPDLASQLGEYFDQVQVPHAADYAFGERLCFAPQASTDSLSIRGAYELFLPWLVTGAQPWERPAARLLDLRAALWLRDAGVTAAPAGSDGWMGWLDRVARTSAAFDSADLPLAALTAERRFDVALAQSLAHAHTGDFGPAYLSLQVAESAYGDELAPSIERRAPAALLRLMAGDPPSPEVQGDAVLWLEGMDRLMARWQPLKSERRGWLQAVLPLAREWGVSDLRWRASAELEGPDSGIALQAQLAVALARERAGDIAGAVQMVQALLAAAPDGDALRNTALDQLPRLTRQLRAGRTRPLPSIADCDYSAWLSWAPADGAVWSDWIAQFSGELDRGLRTSLRGVKVPPLWRAAESAPAPTPGNEDPAAALSRHLTRSFAFILIAADHGAASEWCRRETEAFLEMYGDAARERLYIVALTPDAEQQVLHWPLWQQPAAGPPATLAFYDDAGRPLPILLGNSTVGAAFFNRMDQLRDQLALQIRRSTDKSPSAPGPLQRYAREANEQLLPELSIDVRIIDAAAALPPIDSAELAHDLLMLRLTAAALATDAPHYNDLAALAEAQHAAGSGDLALALAHLRRAGTWLWTIAVKDGRYPALAAARDAIAE